MIAADQQHALSPGFLALLKTPHHCRATIKIAPTLEVCYGNAKLVADRLEQIAQIQLLDSYLDINVETVPNTERRIVPVRLIAQIIEPAIDLIINIVAIYSLKANRFAS